MGGKRKKSDTDQEPKKRKSAKKSTEKQPSNAGESVSIGEEDFQAMAE